MSTKNRNKSKEINQLTIFQGKHIRSVQHNSEWWYSVVDIIEVLTDSQNPRRYWSDLKSKFIKEGSQLYDNSVQLKMLSSDNKEYLTDALRVEDVLRLVQSVPSPKAEPFKKWLAKVGYERLQEHRNPEQMIERALLFYHSKGYDEAWIKVRVKNIVGRKELEGEWSHRGIKQGLEFALLTDAISMETFGIKTAAHKQFKQLGQSHNLRDNMTSLELVFTSLAEHSTIKIAQIRNAQGFPENEQAAKSGGKIAGDARLNLEKELGETIVSPQNFLTEKQRRHSQSLPSAQIRFSPHSKKKSKA